MMNRKAVIAIGAAFAGLALLLSPDAAAPALVGLGSPLLPKVRTGVWLFRGFLLFHAAVLVGLSWVRLTPRGDELLESPDFPTGWGRAERLALGGLLGLALGLRLYDLGDGLWFDEIRTLVGYVRQPPGVIISTFESQNQHLLYSLLARLSVGLLGESAWALRLPAAVLGVGSIWAVYWFGRLITSQREAFLAAALLTLSYHHVWFSQNARGYSGLLCLSVLASGIFVRLLRSQETGWRLPLLYAGVMALAVYTQVSAIFVAASHLAVWLILVWRGRRNRMGSATWLPLAALALAGTLTLQLYAPVLPQFFGTLTTPTMAGLDTEWKSPLWLLTETVRGLTEGLPGGWLSLAPALLVGLAGTVSYWREDRWVLTLMLLPALLTGAAYLVIEHNLWPRMFFFGAGFVALIAMRGIFAVAATVLGQRRSLLPATIVAGLVVLVSGSTVPRAWQPKQDFRGAQAFVERTRQDGDAVVTVDLSRYPFQSYLSAGWSTVDNLAALQEIERQHTRTWVLYTFPTRLAAVQPDIWARLNADYTKVTEFPGTVGGGSVVIMVRG